MEYETNQGPGNTVGTEKNDKITQISSTHTHNQDQARKKTRTTKRMERSEKNYEAKLGDTSDAGVVGDADGADRVVALGGDFAGAARPVAVRIDEVVARHRVVVVAVHVVTRLRILKNTHRHTKTMITAIFFLSKGKRWSSSRVFSWNKEGHRQSMETSSGGWICLERVVKKKFFISIRWALRPIKKEQTRISWQSSGSDLAKNISRFRSMKRRYSLSSFYFIRTPS